MPGGSHERSSVASRGATTTAALTAIVPTGAKRFVHDRIASARRRRAWPRLAAASAELRAVAPADPPSRLLEELREGWGDPDSAPVGLMLAAIAGFRDGRLDGVECGSGLSTVVMGIYAEALGRHWWALDQDVGWMARVRDAVTRLGIDDVTVLDAPLTRYDGFEWYSVPDRLPRSIDFVLCDGPPANGEAIRLRRYGLVPVLADRFTPDVTILLDDASRPGEREVLAKWERCGFRWRAGEATREFAIVTRAT